MKKTLTSLALAGLLLSGATPLFAQDAPVVPDAPVVAEESAGYADQALFLGAEILNLLMIVLAVAILSFSIGRYGQSELSTIFGYFLAGTIFLGLTRLFILLADNGVLAVSEETMAVGWHVILYLSLITFIMGGRGLVRLGKAQGSGSSSKALVGWSLFSAVCILVIFLSAKVVNDPLTAEFAGSTLDRSGIIHLLAFALGIIASLYLFTWAKVGQITKVLAKPFLFAFLLMGLQHFWEVLTESWRVIDLPSATIERVELIFIVPAFLLIAYAFVRLWKLANAPAA